MFHCGTQSAFHKITPYLLLLSIWRNIQFGSQNTIILQYIQACNNHCKTNLGRMLNVLHCVPISELSPYFIGLVRKLTVLNNVPLSVLSLYFIELLTISHFFQFKELFILGDNALLH
jgi:hypothetical protein